jgi:hypothetical protein
MKKCLRAEENDVKRRVVGLLFAGWSFFVFSTFFYLQMKTILPKIVSFIR